MSLRVLDLADPTLAAELQGRDLAISASAGSGKTFTLVTLVLGFLGTGEHRAFQLRAATFGREAAADLRQRALKPLDQLAAWTGPEWAEGLAALRRGFGTWDDWVKAKGQRMEIAFAARQWLAPGEPAWAASPAEARMHWIRARREAELMEISTVHSLATAVLRERGLRASVLEAQDPALLRLLRQAGREALDREVAEEDRLPARQLLAWAEGWHGGGDGWSGWAAHFDAHQDALGAWRGDTDTEEARETFWHEAATVAAAYAPFGEDPFRAAEPTRSGRAHGKFDPSRFPAPFAGEARGPELLRFLEGLSHALVDEKKRKTKNYTGEAFNEAMRPLLEELPAQWEHWCTLLLERVFARFRELKRARELRSYGDLVRDAIALLEADAPQGPELLLVDEYQDINPGQERLLRLLQPKATVVVGDPKQAIYRFRGGEASLLQARLREAGSGAFRLPANHRSAAPVVELANVFVREVAGGLDPEGFGPEGGQRHEGAGEGEARVGLAVVASEKKGADLAAATPWIAGLARDEGWAASGFAAASRPTPRRRALLLARRTGLPALRRALQDQGIEPLVQSTEGFWESPGVRLMLALLEAAGRPERAAPLAALLRSPLVGLRDPELLDLRDELAKGLGGLDTARLGEAGAWLAALRGASTQELVASALARPGLLELVRAAQAHGALEPERARRNLERFLDLVPALPRHPATAFAALDQVRRAKDPGDAPAEGARADLLIQTVHASKGLEYEDVIMPLLNHRPMHLAMGAVGRVDGRLALASRFGVAPGPAFRALRDQDQRGHLRDTLNQAYVGLTRARDRLLLVAQGDGQGAFAAPKDGAEDHHLRWHHLGLELQERAEAAGHFRPAGPPPVAPAAPASAPALAAPSHGALPPAAPPPPKEEAEALELRRKRGILVHALLREVLVRHATDPAAALACLEASPALKAFPGARELVLGFLAALEARDWTSLPRRTELPLQAAAASGATGFADLVVWEPDRAAPSALHLVDFKLAADFGPEQLEGYRQQLARYRAALQARHPGVPVSAELFALGGAGWVAVD
ncbi:MAG TPA: UvrD-helicase domain-containing protein [Holophagaceae bacterium]|nr:UvrD-helicase domain-containing protein [Holophagaceae bacterium]